MSNNQQVTVTLTEEYWKVIMDFIKYSCQLKEDDWIKWGQEINQNIQLSIDKTIGENSIKGIKRTAVSSSTLNSVGYDLLTKTLEIQFNDGSVYQYYQVPQETYVSLMKAESHGKYFYAVIRNEFRYKKVGYEPLQGYRKTVYDHDYDYENSGNLKSILDMDFMSDEEFDTWLEDEAD
jgi:hypothetical protein